MPIDTPSHSSAWDDSALALVPATGDLDHLGWCCGVEGTPLIAAQESANPEVRLPDPANLLESQVTRPRLGVQMKPPAVGSQWRAGCPSTARVPA